MFIALLVVTLGIALGVSFVVVRLFDNPIKGILDRIIAESLSAAWRRYITFAIYVVGISGGVRVYQLERYITGSGGEGERLVLTADRWTLEVYRTVIETLQAVAWMLLVFFIFAMLAYVVMRGFELKQDKKKVQTAESGSE